jgi:hypothetical protein
MMINETRIVFPPILTAIVVIVIFDYHRKRNNSLKTTLKNMLEGRTPFLFGEEEENKK